ncbi:HNH endonuclease, partial [Paenibacillus timonensis]|nr:HNH endonuclease [Paenibacillus timonensis]
MSISSKTRKMLWGRAANRCAICKIELVMDETETDDESVIGDECHIVAREEDGPRGESILSKEQRDKYNNLILLYKI